MTSEITTYNEQIFEDIKHINDDGQEYWLARELQTVLDYTQWRNFKETIDKTEATITWYIPAITLIRQNHIKGINQKLRILLNRKKYCHHFCHAEVQNSRLQ